MSKPSFVYVTYINSTAEKVWRALTDGEVTRQYWANHRNVSDWKVGSEWQHQAADNPDKVDIVGTVILNEKPNRLVVSWASPKFAADPEQVSRVTYEIAADGPVVRLTVTHEELQAGSNMLQNISGGWPMVLSNLKSFLETGGVIPELFARPSSRWGKAETVKA